MLAAFYHRERKYSHLHRNIDVYLIALDIIPHTRQEQLNLHSRHTQRSRQQRHRKALQPTEQVLSIPQPQHLLPLPPSPGAHRPLVLLLHHILEARFLKILLVLPDSRPILADPRRRLHDQVYPLLQRGAGH